VFGDWFLKIVNQFLLSSFSKQDVFEDQLLKLGDNLYNQFQIVKSSESFTR
jgi:hypothetical protein